MTGFDFWHRIPHHMMMMQEKNNYSAGDQSCNFSHYKGNGVIFWPTQDLPLKLRKPEFRPDHDET